MSDVLPIAEAIARRAGAIVREGFGHVRQVRQKGVIDLYDIRTNPRNNLAQFAQFQLRTQGVRRLGSAAIDCAWTALGRLDGYWEFGIKPWDIAAGGLLVRGAGGRATSTEGDEEFMSTGTIVVSNGLLHEQMLRVLREGDDAPLPQ